MKKTKTNYFFNKRDWLNSLQKELNTFYNKIQECRKKQYLITKNKDFDISLNNQLTEYTTDYAWKLLELQNVKKSHLR